MENSGTTSVFGLFMYQSSYKTGPYYVLYQVYRKIRGFVTRGMI